jgi:hypothetical protein
MPVSPAEWLLTVELLDKGNEFVTALFRADVAEVLNNPGSP